MQCVHFSHSDSGGGAARAAYRIHHALRRHGIDSMMCVNSANSGDWTVQGPVGKVAKLVVRVRPQAAALARALLRTENSILHSPNILPSAWSRRFNSSGIDVAHLHWVAGEMMSIADIGRFRKPVVWTFHDMWAFCGAEHYTEDLRWRESYSSVNRPAYEGGFDLNRWTWRRKKKHWQRPMHIVTPSHWLSDCVRESALMHDWPVTVVPNAIDTDAWQPIEKRFARELFGLPKDAPIALFGAIGGGKDYRKGFDLLRGALDTLLGEVSGLELLVFGELPPKDPVDLAFPIHYVGHLHDELSLRVLYSAADVLVIPSRQDNLPNTGVEALACGTPVVAFDAGGLPDIVQHQVSGYLAKAFDVTDLANGIRWVLENATDSGLGSNARKHAVSLFSYPVVARQYEKVYQSVIAG